MLAVLSVLGQSGYGSHEISFLVWALDEIVLDMFQLLFYANLASRLVVYWV